MKTKKTKIASQRISREGLFHWNLLNLKQFNEFKLDTYMAVFTLKDYFIRQSKYLF